MSGEFSVQQYHARIMVVDDEAANLKLLDKMLRTQGYTNILLVQDSRQALKFYREMRPDLILLDINMPHLDGYQVMEQLKALKEPLLPPIVILTAQHGRDYLLRALTEGARDFIGKPFDRTELLMRVRNLLDAQLAHRFVYDQREALENMVRERTDELNKTRLQIVRRLGRAAEHRDNETGLHILRMSYYSAILARAVGWSEAQCELLLHASPMHDIGKIGIPDTILLKPGKLDEQEWEIMKTHTTIGATILQDADTELLELASIIALSHHEKWDGSGYPKGLKGWDIPKAGRIVAVADVFDALTSARPYKKPWTVKDAAYYIEDNGGKHFDPEIAERFKECLPRLLEVRNRYLDPGEAVSEEAEAVKT